MNCIIGLGNPGSRYRRTRHNAGFLAIEWLIEKFRAVSYEGNEDYESFIFHRNDNEILLVMQQTFMNDSGVAVKRILERHEIPSHNIMVVYDDYQLPFGTLRMREKGTDGGHNGMASTIYQLGSDVIPRLRIGVAGRTIPEEHIPEAMADYVLSSFTAEEQKLLPQILQCSADALLCWADEGIAKSMSLFNRNFLTDASAS